MTVIMQGVHSMLADVVHNSSQWTALSEALEQQMAAVAGHVEVMRVACVAQKKKGEAGKPAVALLERAVADLQAQLTAEQKSHRLTQVSTETTSSTICEYSAVR